MVGYPNECDVKVEWTWVHQVVIASSFLVLWPIYFYLSDMGTFQTNKLLMLGGLNIDIIGVVVASLKTPFYGYFHDGGKLETIRLQIESKYFQAGMLLIAVGFFMQALGTLL